MRQRLGIREHPSAWKRSIEEDHNVLSDALWGSNRSPTLRRDLCHHDLGPLDLGPSGQAQNAGTSYLFHGVLFRGLRLWLLALATPRCIRVLGVDVHLIRASRAGCFPLFHPCSTYWRMAVDNPGPTGMLHCRFFLVLVNTPLWPCKYAPAFSTALGTRAAALQR